MADLKVMAKFTLIFLLFGLAASLAGCASNIQRMETVQATNGTPFTQALTEEYRGFVAHEKEEGDWDDADYFARKGLAAAGGEVVLPEEVAGVPDNAAGPLTEGRSRLMAALDGGARDSNPKVAAQAQRAFDCWQHEAHENLGEDHLADCRDEFLRVMEQLAAKPMPVAQPGTYVVLFDWNKDNITPAGQAVIDQVLADAKTMGTANISATGHADRSGSEEYNMGLSLRRADAVRAALIAGGIPAEAITVAGRGESEPAVPTPDGVREQANRRVVIILQ